MTLSEELEDFLATHRLHGALQGDTGELTPNGYRLAVACSCGVTFHRWITPREAAEDLTLLAPRHRGASQPH
jgi:hypothetical protein